MTYPKPRPFNPLRPRLAVLDGNTYLGTVMGRASVRDVVDRLRDLKTRLGARPYQVKLIRTQWSGGARGSGVEEVVLEQLIQPTPAIAAMTAMGLTQQPTGLDEVGVLRVSEISGFYTEDELRGLGPNGEEIPDDQQFYWEIAFPKPAPMLGVKRRYVIRTAPAYQADMFQWSIDLLRTSEDRGRGGEPQG